MSRKTGSSNLDEWIRKQSFRIAYSDATKGFIGKKALRDALCTQIPVEFGGLGYTPEKVKARLTAMLAEHLTAELLMECDSRRIASMSGNNDTGGMVSSGNAAEQGGPREMKGGGLPRARDKGKQRAIDEDRTKAPPPTSGVKPASAPAGPAPKIELKSPKLGVSGSLADAYKKAAAASVGVQETNGSTIPSLGESTTPITRSPSLLSTGGDASSANASSSTLTRSVVPSLPFKIQYRIFTALQAILESCCYDFAQRYYSTYLRRKSWDCPERGELRAWIRGLSREFSSNPVFDMGEDEFDLILKKGGEIRHAAVHRVPVSGLEIRRLIEDARAMAEILDDEERLAEIDEIKAVMDANVQTLLDKRRAKEEKLRLELEKLEHWKREIELQEMRAIQDAEEEEDKIHRSFQDGIARELEALGLEVKGIGVRNRGGDMEEQAGAAEHDGAKTLAATSEGVEDEFREPQGWPAEEDAIAEQLMAVGSISTLSI